MIMFILLVFAFVLSVYFFVMYSHDLMCITGAITAILIVLWFWFRCYSGWWISL